MCRGVIRSKGDYALIMRNRLPELSLRRQPRTQIVVRIRIVRLQSQSTLVVGHSLVDTPQILKCRAEVVMDFGVVWSCSQRLFITSHRLGKPDGAMMPHRVIENRATAQFVFDWRHQSNARQLRRHAPAQSNQPLTSESSGRILPGGQFRGAIFPICRYCDRLWARDPRTRSADGESCRTARKLSSAFARMPFRRHTGTIGQVFVSISKHSTIRKLGSVFRTTWPRL